MGCAFIAISRKIEITIDPGIAAVVVQVVAVPAGGKLLQTLFNHNIFLSFTCGVRGTVPSVNVVVIQMPLNLGSHPASGTDNGYGYDF